MQDGDLMVMWLLQFHADPTLVDADGKTPAGRARDHGNKTLATTLDLAAEQWTAAQEN